MNFFDIITHTPLYVWALSGYVTYVGIKALKPHEIYVPLLLGIPCLFLSVQLSSLNTTSQNELLYLSTFVFVGLLIGIIYGMNRPVTIIKERMSILFPGTVLSLMLYVSYFISMYYFGFIKMVNPDLFLTLSLPYTIIKGLFTGFLLGKAFFYVYFYYKNQ